MTVWWTVRAANDRSAQFAQESNPTVSARKSISFSLTGAFYIIKGEIRSRSGGDYCKLSFLNIK